MKIRGIQSRIQTISIIKNTLGYLFPQFVTFEEVTIIELIAYHIKCPILGKILFQVKTVHSELFSNVLPAKIKISIKLPTNVAIMKIITVSKILIDFKV